MHNQDTSEASREQRGRSQHRTRNCTADIGSPVTIRHGIYNYNYNYNYRQSKENILQKSENCLMETI